MLSKESRKAAARNFKEQTPAIGIYAVRSTVSGHAWVGASKNLNAMKNSCWFQLRNRLHREQSLQREWDAQGEMAFLYEIVDRLDEDVHAIEIDDQLRDKRSIWAAQLNAQPLL